MQTFSVENDYCLQIYTECTVLNSINEIYIYFQLNAE